MRPIDTPPLRAAPSHTACMTPWRPPHSTTSPQRASPSPTSSAAASCAGVASRGPMTPIGTRNGVPLSRCNHATASTSAISSASDGIGPGVQRRASASKRRPSPSTSAPFARSMRMAVVMTP
jgi:hypothetical protein